ncbi:amino acid ABC transporter permease [Bacillus sp. HMF5848]|uniref:amino acid ABC transporter permease n=1 Tax=Bacillus sp. HMF5848 TaxID=2495421 RepID=UPI000F79E6FE|nr:amino acid ABC transporter permease [Bacillus sp. HMF5848]RSK26796.1 amino acid ABC transporter permease [Bacillus sp. HMF5848]
MSDLQLQFNQKPKQAPKQRPKQAFNLFQWIKINLFSSWFNSLLTIFSLLLSGYILTNTFVWIAFEANWAVISANFKLLAVGQFPVEDIWRLWVSLSYTTLLLGLTWGIWRGTAKLPALFVSATMAIVALMPFIQGDTRLWLIANIAITFVGFGLGLKFEKLNKIAIVAWVLLFPFVMFLLKGFGVLSPVNSNLWGGFLLTLLIALVSIVVSFPLGILLALGRRSKLPIVKYFSILYIELIRGIPLITVLFISQLMLPLFLGNDVELDNVTRAMIGFTLFNAAYFAENIRGGLQSLPRGQFEAAQALGLNHTLMMTFIIMPQALRTVIPAMVGQCIALFKDTSLVGIIGLIDLLGMGKKIIANPQFLGTQMEVFVFIATIFFAFCYLMSYMSRQLEKALGVGER